jgi:hypothetical protein
MGQCRILPQFKDGNHLVVLPRCWEVMGVEGCIEYLDEEGYRSLEKMLQGSFWNTVWVWSLADIGLWITS